MRRRAAATRPTADPQPEDFLPLPHLPFNILLALAEEPRHGWAIIRRIEEISGGKEVPSSGSLYMAMGRLEERGLLEDAPDQADDGRRRTFRITPLGRRVLAAETERLALLVELSRGWASGADP